MSDFTQQMAVAKRVTIVDTLGAGSDGESLRGQNVNNYPEGATFYVKASNRYYRLKKNLNPLILIDPNFFNIVDGIASSAVNGRFIAVDQFATGVLVGGEGGSTVTISGFDLDPGGLFAVNFVTLGGGSGFLIAAAAAGPSLTDVLVTSSSATDTGTVFVQFTQSP